jgi:hypothetical protein
MNGLSSLNNVLVHGSQAPVFVDARSSLDLLSRTQGLGMSQELPPERDSFPFQPTISQEQRWDVAYFPKGDHVVVSGDGVFVPSAIFGQSPDLHYVTQTGPCGREVVVFSRLNASHGHEACQQSEQHWLVANRLMYVGLWVALSGDRLLSTGSNASEVYNKARSLGVAVPFVTYIDPDDHLPFAGW